MKTLSTLFFFLSIIFFPCFAYAASPSLLVSPASVIQGEPVEIIVQNATPSQVRSISFGGKKLSVFSYQNHPMALVGVDINQNPATYTVSVLLSEGTTLTKSVIVSLRPKIATAFDIPEALGGNATSSAQTFVSTLAQENTQLLALGTNKKTLWTNPFTYPLAQITVTDGYGYSRETSGTSVTHKGTDFRAKVGTPVMAMNRGVVRLTKNFVDYGNTIVVDHGQGLMTFYMHLSKINVNVGELVRQGQLIALSGQTGDALAPHLHVSVRINKVSIDPVKFMALFK